MHDVMMANVPPKSDLAPNGLLRLFQRASFRRKLGFGELLFGRALARHCITWVDFGDLRWKLNLANGTHRWLVYGEYEEPGVRLLLERVIDEKSIIVDSGANIGQMVVMYLRSSSAEAIHAFEPTPMARAWLEECVAANGLGSVFVSPLALGEAAGTANLVDHDFQHKEGAQNRLTASDDGLPIEVTTLDAYAESHGIKHIRFWKLDTEGHELPALVGARSLLQRAAIDYLYVETAGDGDAIAELLAKYRYVPVGLALDRVLSRAEVRARFTNVFVSDRVARAECGLALKAN